MPHNWNKYVQEKKNKIVQFEFYVYSRIMRQKWRKMLFNLQKVDKRDGRLVAKLLPI